jgi:large subunit ribosomal protein L18e
MISKTQITKRTKKKRNPYLVETINLAKKKGELELAKKLSSPQSNYTKINIDQLNEVKEDKILVVGKVLGMGDIEKKKQVVALGFSKSAIEKLKKAGCETLYIKDKLEKGGLKDFKIL